MKVTPSPIVLAWLKGGTALVLAALLLFVSSACGPAQPGQAAPQTGPLQQPTVMVPTATSVPCTMTLSGAVSKTLDCTVQAAYSTADGETSLGIISVSRVTQVPEAQLLIQVNGQAAPGNYTWSNSVIQAGSVYEGGTDAFAAASKDARGASQVTISSMQQEAAVNGSAVYSPHGTASATLVGPSGTVQMTVTF